MDSLFRFLFGLILCPFTLSFFPELSLVFLFHFPFFGFINYYHLSLLRLLGNSSAVFSLPVFFFLFFISFRFCHFSFYNSSFTRSLCLKDLFYVSIFLRFTLNCLFSFSLMSLDVFSPFAKLSYSPFFTFAVFGYF